MHCDASLPVHSFASRISVAFITLLLSICLSSQPCIVAASFPRCITKQKVHKCVFVPTDPRPTVSKIVSRTVSIQRHSNSKRNCAVGRITLPWSEVNEPVEFLSTIEQIDENMQMNWVNDFCVRTWCVCSHVSTISFWDFIDVDLSSNHHSLRALSMEWFIPFVRLETVM